MPDPLRIVVLDGDETGQELLEEALRVLDPDLLDLPLELERFDLSLENRRATRNAVVTEAAAAMKDAGFGLKAATVTPEGRDDVGSPNRIVREAVGGKVIVRTGRHIPGVVGPVSGVHHPISVVRMAVDDAYGAKEWRDEARIAYRTEKITRSTCHAVAEYSFRMAERTGAHVYGGPKWTVSPTYEGLLKEELDAAAARHPDVPYEPVLIDALYAGLIGGAADKPLIIPALNRDGDCLSDLVLPMFGSIAGAESVLLAFDEDYSIDVAMAEAPHGTAPVAAGQGRRQPDGDAAGLGRRARLRRGARLRGRGRRFDGDLRRRHGEHRGRGQDRRPRRRRLHERVHVGGDRARARAHRVRDPSVTSARPVDGLELVAMLGPSRRAVAQLEPHATRVGQSGEVALRGRAADPDPLGQLAGRQRLGRLRQRAEDEVGRRGGVALGQRAPPPPARAA